MSAYDAVRPTWREEARRDKESRARLDMERESARAQLRLAELQFAADARRERALAKAEARARAREARAARISGALAWLTGHVIGLLFIPVIGVPAALAWSAMAAYGARLYPFVGYLLPAFSEGAMWAFAAAVTLTLRRDPGRPVWHLRAGIAVFAVFGGALNFLHGLTVGGAVDGIVMALVSDAGVTAHQLVTAGPRRSRAERDDDRFGRAAARRERRARRAALRSTGVDMDARGNARLVYQAGPATLERRFGSTRLVPVKPERRPVLALPAAPPAHVPVAAPETDETEREEEPQQAPEDPVLTAIADALERVVAALPGTDENAPDTASAAVPMVPLSAEEAALAAMRATHAAGNPFSVNQLQTRFKLTRSAATKVRGIVLGENADDHGGKPLNEAERRVQAWPDKHGMSGAVDPGPAVRYAPADDEPVTGTAPEPDAI
ncbi:MAG TPA: hypothetical protein VG142_11960 [Trebonia sp.]|nr:hypothetical protein [Trebonia sp.]